MLLCCYLGKLQWIQSLIYYYLVNCTYIMYIPLLVFKFSRCTLLILFFLLVKSRRYLPRNHYSGTRPSPVVMHQVFFNHLAGELLWMNKVSPNLHVLSFWEWYGDVVCVRATSQNVEYYYGNCISVIFDIEFWNELGRSYFRAISHTQRW